MIQLAYMTQPGQNFPTDIHTSTMVQGGDGGGVVGRVLIERTL